MGWDRVGGIPDSSAPPAGQVRRSSLPSIILAMHYMKPFCVMSMLNTQNRKY